MAHPNSVKVFLERNERLCNPREYPNLMSPELQQGIHERLLAESRFSQRAIGDDRPREFPSSFSSGEEVLIFITEQTGLAAADVLQKGPWLQSFAGNLRLDSIFYGSQIGNVASIVFHGNEHFALHLIYKPGAACQVLTPAEYQVWEDERCSLSQG
ncbi:MAG: hypothetical protein AAB383_05705 [Patescibacteria group bacterium]